MSRIQILAYAPECIKDTRDIEDIKIFLKYKKSDGQDYELVYIPEVCLIRPTEDNKETDNE